MAAAARALIGVLTIHMVASQSLNVSVTGNGICSTIHCKNVNALKQLKECVVIVGDLRLLIPRVPYPNVYENITFYNLREITGYMAVYQVPVLWSLGHLFPNLVRVRGLQLLNNYALIVYEMPQLEEIGLFSLIKVDRGGVVMWGGPDTCNVETIDWETISPRSRHVLSLSENTHCSKECRCSLDATYNYCWNNKKCQRFLEGPEKELCHEQCFGCRNTEQLECSLCRHFTHNTQCVAKCPEDTIILQDSQYCITEDECHHLDRFVWNGTCIAECPIDYVLRNQSGSFSCQLCIRCETYCPSQKIGSLSTIQEAEKCVYINGSLTIHVRGVPNAIEVLRNYLRRIEEVSDYIEIYDSLTLDSIDFLPSLKRIGGRVLKDKRFSVILNENPNLQKLFPPNVLANLKIDNGTLKAINNPMLCLSEINKLKEIIPVKPNEDDIPLGMNGYSGGCEDVNLGINVSNVEETSAVITFSFLSDPKMHYTILYVRLPPGNQVKIVPESCSDYEWHAVHVNNYTGRVELNSLRPASTYAVCIETFDHKEYLARSSLLTFSTLVGKPQPPFILELVASYPDVVVIRWVDHLDYVQHITHYELDISIIEIRLNNISISDECYNNHGIDKFDIMSHHAVVMRPPADYARGCESMCGILSSVPEGALVEEHFDVCTSLGSACNEVDEEPLVNTYDGAFIRTASLIISSPRNNFQVGNLAPYRDYKFQLRACTATRCSRSARGVVRTLKSMEADVAVVTCVEAKEYGFISIQWTPPALSNGPVLAYKVEIIPDLPGKDTLLAKSWCVPRNQTYLVVKSERAEGYLLRLCTLTLAPLERCSKVIRFLRTPKEETTPWGWAVAVICVIILCISILVIRHFRMRRKENTEDILLVDITSSFRPVSEPPIFTMSDFAPLHHTHEEQFNTDDTTCLL